MLQLFTEHPTTVNESYLEHLVFATMFGCRMLNRVQFERHSFRRSYFLSME
jgi:hypothetical protein